MTEIAEIAGSQEWIDPIAKTLDTAVSKAFQGETGRGCRLVDRIRDRDGQLHRNAALLIGGSGRSRASTR